MPERAPTLRDMIQEALNSGLTLRKLQEQAIDPRTGATAGKDTFSKISHDKMDRMPELPQLRAIAAGLRAPYESVRQAAIAQWAPAEDADAERDELIRELRELRAKTEKVLARLGDDEPESESA